MERIVVTGASGNVGAGVLRELVARHPDSEIIGVCRRPPPPTPPYDRVASWAGRRDTRRPRASRS